jgi:RimJ/RimL family protein N-acetyltransferase
MDKILSYLELGRQEGAQVLIGGARAELGGELAGGYYVQPTLFKGHNQMRIFREEIFGPVLAVTTFKDEAEALQIANDTPYGLGAGVWTRDGSRAYRMGRAIQAGRVWTNCYHAYPAHAAFGGYKESGIGRETHKAMLDHYQQTKNLLVSYSPEVGFTLAPAAQGRGLATRAVRGALEQLWALTAARHVLGCTDARNTPSSRLLQRLGFQRVAERSAQFRGEACVEWDYRLERPL